MIDYGSSMLGDAIECMYNYYEVACISNDILAIDKATFSERVSKGYAYCNYLKSTVNDTLLVSVTLNVKGDKPFLWVEYRGNRDENVQMLLVEEPEEASDEK
jgi:hypothetical protein